MALVKIGKNFENLKYLITEIIQYLITEIIPMKKYVIDNYTFTWT